MVEILHPSVTLFMKEQLLKALFIDVVHFRNQKIGCHAIRKL
jgi:hypothetical protein